MSSGLFTKLPVFTLFRCEPTKVAKLYAEGHFAKDFWIPKPGACNIDEQASGGAVFSPSYGTDSSAHIFTYRDKSGSETVLVSSNCNIPDEGKKKRCHWCRLKFTGPAVGIVISRDHYVDDKGRVIFHFLTEGIYCDFACKFAGLYHDKGSEFEKLYPYALSDSLGLFKLMHPDAKVPEMAKDWRLLKANGGSMDLSAWRDQSYSYTFIPILEVKSARLFHQRRGVGK